MTEKQSKAAALQYDSPTDASPRVTARGKGYLADSIIEKAEASNVPIVEDAALAELLAELNVNENIPEELYEAVAEVFAFIYRLDQKVGKTKRKST